MKHFSFGDVAFVRANCLDRRKPVLLRGCFGSNCKAASFMCSRICQQRVSQSQKQTYVSLHLFLSTQEFRHSLNKEITNLVFFCNFSTVRKKKKKKPTEIVQLIKGCRLCYLCHLTTSLKIGNIAMTWPSDGIS